MPEGCTVDLNDPETQQGLWLQYQRDGGVACPETGAPLELALARDAEDPATVVAQVGLRCGRCGRRVVFSPPDGAEVHGWAE